MFYKKLFFVFLFCFFVWWVFAQDVYTNLNLKIDAIISHNPNKLEQFLMQVEDLKQAYAGSVKKLEILDNVQNFLTSYEIPNPLKISYAQKVQMWTVVSKFLHNYFTSEEIPSSLEWLPEIDFDKMFLTILKDWETRCCQSWSTKGDFGKYIQQSTLNCINDTRFGGKLKADEIDDVQYSFSFLFNPHDLDTKNIDTAINLIKPWIHGIQIKNWTKTAFFKETVQIEKNYTTQQALERLCIKAWLDKECYTDNNTKITLFDTYTFKIDQNNEIQNLYRYNILVSQSSVDNDSIKNSLSLAKQRYLKSINKDTWLLEYLYYPSKATYEQNDNNHIRQLASAWLMSEIDDFFGTLEFKQVIDNMIQYYLGFTQTKRDYTYINIANATIANNAFMIMTLLDSYKYDIIPQEEIDNTLQNLAKWILAMQREDGSYQTSFTSTKDSWVDFYPWEAMLALMKLYEHTKDEQYLNSVYKAFDYYKTYWQNNKNTAFVPWHSQVDYLLYQYKPEKKISDFVFEMNDWLIQNHQIQQTNIPDELWWFTKYSPRISTASYMEWINDAYALAKQINDEKHIKSYTISIILATRFIMQLQFTPENIFYVTQPEYAIWWFKQSLVDNQLRNDNTQHASSALMKIYNNGIFKE